MPCVVEPAAEPAGAPVDEHEREADDDRRDRERQVDQQPEQRPAAEAAALEQQRHADPEDRVQRHDDRDQLDRQPEGVHGVRAVSPRSHTGAEAVFERAVEDHRHGRQQQQREVAERDVRSEPLREPSRLGPHCGRRGGPRRGRSRR